MNLSLFPMDSPWFRRRNSPNGETPETLRAVEERLDVTLSGSFKRLLQDCSGANLPAPSYTGFWPLVCLWSTHYWKDVSNNVDSMLVPMEFCDDYDTATKKSLDRRILIGNNPHAADYGQYLVLRVHHETRKMTIEAVLCNIPETTSYASLEAYLKETPPLTGEEYLQGLVKFHLENLVDTMEDDSFATNNTAEQQQSLLEQRIMEHQVETVLFYADCTQDDCARTAWNQHCEAWKTTMVPKIIDAIQSKQQEQQGDTG
jgi:hypothetical protein